MTRFKPKVVCGGRATHIKDNLYYMSGRKHEAGGIDIGKNPRTGLEVEDGEVIQTDSNGLKVFSAQPILNGNSPAKLVMSGANPAKVFNAQERFKEINGINDDGTKKKQNGGKVPNRKKYVTALTNDEEKQFQSWYSKVAKYKNLNNNPDADGQDYDYRGYWKNEDRNGILGSNPNAHFTDKYKQPTHPTFSDESQYSNNETPGGTWVKGKDTWLFKHNKYTARQANRTADYLNGTGEGYILGTDTIIPNKRKKMGGIRKDYPTLVGDYYGRQEAKTIKALRNARTNPQYQGRNLNLPTLSMNDTYGNLPVTPSNRTAIERTNAKYNTPATKPKTKRQSFNSAFAAARKQGLSEFTWNGKQYGTQVAGSSKPKTNQQTTAKSSITSNNLPEVTITTPRINSRLINQLESNRYVPSKPKPIQEHTVKVESNTVSPVKRRSTINDKPGRIGYIDNNGDVIYGKSGSNEVGDILSAGFNDMIEYGRGLFNRKKKVGGRVVTVNGNVKSGLVISPSPTGEREKAAVGKDYDFRIDTTKYKIGDTFEYKGKRYKVTGRNAAKLIGSGTDKDVEAAARRDAKGARTDFRDMLERPQYTPDKIESKPKAVTTRSTKVEQPVQTTTTTKQTKVTAPRRGSGKSKSKPAAKPAKPNDIIGLAGNIGGSIASAINTRKSLNDMETPSEPMYEVPAAMKTHFNIRPQISEINENTRRSMDDITANTASSRVALQRKQRLRNAGQYAKNNLYGQKENIETQLINQDRLNRQRVGSRNTAAYNDWRNRTTQFRNAIREQKASSLNNMFSGINAGLQDMLSRIENRRNYNNTLGIYDATHPNTDKRLFRDKGVTI